MKRLTMAAMVALAATTASAQTPVALGQFDQIELRGGGTVTLRQGGEQRVTMLRGDARLTRFTVVDGRLIIDACVRSCRDHDLEVEIVVPSIRAVAIAGGGAVRAQEGFAPRGALALAVSGGGLLDFDDIDAADVAASVRGGGHIRARARANLAASVQGGGVIDYWGDPEVVSSVRGGGVVRAGGTG
jgi:hypothetical protein